MSDIRRDFGGEISPETNLVRRACQLVEYGGGGGALGYIEVPIKAELDN